jgi:hypothetical protein
MKKGLFIALSICIVASLFIFIRATDLTKALFLVAQIGYRFYLLLAITFIAYLLGTLSWKYCLGNAVNNLSTGRLFLIRHVGETAAWFNPTSIIGGDTLKGILLGKHKIDHKLVISSLLLSRLIMIFSQMLLLFITTCYLWIQHQEVSFLRHSFLKYATLSLGTIGQNASQKFKEAFVDLNILLKTHRRLLVISCGFAILHWLVGSLEFFFILKFLGLKVSILQALLVDLGVIVFKAAGAFIPGQFGIEEYGNKIMLMVIGIPGAEIWVSASVLRRARQLVWTCFGILIYFLMFYKYKPALNT